MALEHNLLETFRAELGHNVFCTPPRYFTVLPYSIKKRCLLIPQTLPYRISEKYFETSKASLVNKLFIRYTHPKVVFKVPERYFEVLTDYLSERIKPLPKGQVFQVPGSYFESLNQKIYKRIQRRAAGIIKVDFTVSAPLYRIAASVTILIAASVLWLQNREIWPMNKTIKPLENEIASLDRTTVRLYLEKQENTEYVEIVEYVSESKRQRIQKEFEKHLLPEITDDKMLLELEWDQTDLSDIQPDI